MDWIDTNLLQPMEDQEVLFTNVNILNPDGTKLKPTVSCGFYHSEYFYSWISTEDRKESSHWMPMPDVPTVEKIRDDKLYLILKD